MFRRRLAADYYATPDSFCDHYERETLAAEARSEMAADEARELLERIAADREDRDFRESWNR